jgi:hypothetical protein
MRTVGTGFWKQTKGQTRQDKQQSRLLVELCSCLSSVPLSADCRQEHQSAWSPELQLGNFRGAMELVAWKPIMSMSESRNNPSRAAEQMRVSIALIGFPPSSTPD